MRRLILGIVLVAGLLLSPARMQGQRSGPTLSDDVQQALARGERVRVIVQAEEDTLLSLRARHGRGLRRTLAGALSLDLSANDAHALRSSSGVAHISGDLPVVANNAYVNKVTSAEKVWAGTTGLLGLFSTSGTPARASALRSSTRALATTRRSPTASSRGSIWCRTSRASPAIPSATAPTSRV